MRFHINFVGSQEGVCIHMGREVLVEFLRAMLILQAQQGVCARR